MINRSNPYILLALVTVYCLSGCSKYRRLLNDEIVFKDGNTQTGTLISCDSLDVKLKKNDESLLIIPWDKIDSVRGKKYKTFWAGFNYGYYSTPYYSVFKNEAITARQFSTQLKLGMAVHGHKLYYANIFNSPAEPYYIKKIGFGYQYYPNRNHYLNPKSFFIGQEINFMNVERNNGSQLTLDPFVGWERKWKEQIRFQLKIGLQLNLFNRNNNTGFNVSLGTTILKKNFQKKYAHINKEHELIR